MNVFKAPLSYDAPWVGDRLTNCCCRKDKKTPGGSVHCKVILLDGSSVTFHLNPSSFGSDLMTLVISHLDLNERDYFSLKYKDKDDNMIWLDHLKKLRVITKDMTAPYEFHFGVKFFISDPDLLKEELTLLHFFLQCKDDARHEKLKFENHILIELVALSIQSNIGDFKDSITPNNTYRPLVFTENPTDEFLLQVQSKHKEFMGMTPNQCEKNFLALFKKHDLYGTYTYTLKYGKNHEHFIGIDSHGIKFNQNQPHTVFIAWNRVNRIYLRNKRMNIKLNNEDPHININYQIRIADVRTARYINRLSREHHIFFKLSGFSIKDRSKIQTSKNFSPRYNRMGRVLFIGSEVSCKLHKHKCTKRRIKLMAKYDKSTYGSVRVGSKVLALSSNGRYLNGIIIQLSKTIVVHLDDSTIIEHSRNTTEGIVSNSIPYEAYIVKGTVVLVKQPENYYRKAKVVSINEKPTFTKYVISYNGDDRSEVTIDEIRILKPPIYFGPDLDSNNQHKISNLPQTISLTCSQKTETELDQQCNKNMEACAKVEKHTRESSTSYELDEDKIEKYAYSDHILDDIDASPSAKPIEKTTENSTFSKPIEQIRENYAFSVSSKGARENSTFTKPIEQMGDYSNFSQPIKSTRENSTFSKPVEQTRKNYTFSVPSISAGENSTFSKPIEQIKENYTFPVPIKSTVENSTLSKPMEYTSENSTFSKPNEHAIENSTFFEPIKETRYFPLYSEPIKNTRENSALSKPIQHTRENSTFSEHVKHYRNKSTDSENLDEKIKVSPFSGLMKKSIKSSTSSDFVSDNIDTSLSTESQDDSQENSICLPYIENNKTNSIDEQRIQNIMQNYGPLKHVEDSRSLKNSITDLTELHETKNYHRYGLKIKINSSSKK